MSNQYRNTDAIQILEYIPSLDGKRQNKSRYLILCDSES